MREKRREPEAQKEQENMQDQEEQGKSRRKRGALWIFFLVLILLGLGVFLLCGTVLGNYYINRQQAEAAYHDLEAEYVKKEPKEEEEKEEEQKTTAEAPKEEEPKEETEEKNIWLDSFEVDFESLKNVNPDIYAWVKIPGTVISYPVLQHPEDNAYYLRHTAKNKAGLPGAIFSENMNSTDFSEFIHILYGHNMRNGSMFHDLHRYEEEGFIEKNPWIYIYTPEHVYIYQVFATVVVSNAHIMSCYDFETEEGKQAYLEALYQLESDNDSRNHYRKDVEVTTENKILTLSTCVFPDRSRRYLVNAVLTEVIVR